ncbi:MAG: DUF2267 domain-containing protein [Gemmatimonadota bacterium]
MPQTEVTALNHTLEETHEWLKALRSKGPFETEQQAYSHMRAVLHAVRDRLTVEEAAHFASELPMLVRGFYYEGWRPALAPNKDRKTVEDFLDAVRESLGDRFTPAADLGAAATAVLELLTERMAEGQVRHARQQMPQDMQAIWPG